MKISYKDSLVSPFYLNLFICFYEQLAPARLPLILTLPLLCISESCIEIKI